MIVLYNVALENNTPVTVCERLRKRLCAHNYVYIICAYCYIVHVVYRRKAPSQNQ